MHTTQTYGGDPNETEAEDKKTDKCRVLPLEQP